MSDKNKISQINQPVSKLPEFDPLSIPGAMPYVPTGKCPVLRKIPANFPLLDTEDILGYQTVDVPAPEEHNLLLMQHRNVVSTRIHPGDLLMIHAQDHAEVGQVIACRTVDNKHVLKRFQQGDTVLGVAVMSITLL